MGRLKLGLIIYGLLTIFSSNAIVITVNTDLVSIGAVGKNTLYLKQREAQHKARLDSVITKQKKILKYTTEMATLRELHYSSLQNTEFQGKDSKIYKNSLDLTNQIIYGVPQLMAKVQSTDWKSRGEIISKLENICLESKNLMEDYVTIVAGQKTKNRAGGDGANFLERFDRLNMAKQINLKLRKNVKSLSILSYQLVSYELCRTHYLSRRATPQSSQMIAQKTLENIKQTFK